MDLAQSSFVVGAAGGASPLVADLGLCLVVAGLLAVTFVRLRIPAIAALLGAGVLLGPTGVAAIQDPQSIDTIANLGLMLLLFVIGLEVNLRSLLTSGRTLVVTGLVQVPLTLAAGFGIFSLLALTGWRLLEGSYVALYLGAACAFSSTLLVVKYLQTLRILDSTGGRLCIGLLIFQDIWAIVFLALQPALANPSLKPIALTFAATAALAVVATVVARFALSRTFHVVARSPELVVTVALGWCFGVGLIGSHLGAVANLVGLDIQISVSMEMGALIAGATIATSPFAYEVVSRVVHVRDFFVTLFFVGIGMSIPMPDGPDLLALALGVGATAILLRYAIFLPVLYATGLDRRNAVGVSTKLAQVSEFCLVIVYLGARLGHVGEDQVSVVIFAFVLTALLTPGLFAMSDRLYQRLRRVLDLIGIRSRGQQAEVETEAPARIVLLGFHRVASALLAELERRHPKLLADLLVIDINTTFHARIQSRGVRVVYGDLASTEVLRHAGVADAEVIVSTVPDELLKGTNNEALVRQLRELAPRATIVATCTTLTQSATLRAAGADYAFHPATEVAIGVLPALFAALDGMLASFIDAREGEHGPLAPQHQVID